MDNRKHQFIYILGPTGVGKSDFALEFAQEYSWPIINIDSLQVYKDLNIGTAKPTKSEMDLAPHYLFDYVVAPNVVTAASYLEDLSSVLLNNKLTRSLFVGGSGFYIQAAQKGLYPESKTPADVKEKVNEWIKAEGYPSLYAWIRENDGEFAKKISVNDQYRVKRTVEIMLTQDKKMTDLKEDMKQKSFSPLPQNHSLNIGFKMDKSDLLKRIQIRTEKMLKSGLIEEVEELRGKGLALWVPLQSVGYKEVQFFLEQNQSLELLQQNIVTSTMQLVKKQMTWFKRSPNIKWFSPQDKSSALKTINEWIQSD